MDKKSKQSTKELEEFKTKYLRALADYQNLERRVRDEKDAYAKEVQARVVVRLLPFLDHLEKAEVFVKDQGLKMIKDQFMKTLNELGVEEMDVMGKEYDPHTAEALEVIPGEEDNKVIEVVEKGYAFDGKLLRPARVKVSKKS